MKAILCIFDSIKEETGGKTGIKNHRLYLPDAKLVISEYGGYVHLRTDYDIELAQRCAEFTQEVNIDFPDGQIFMDWAQAEAKGKEVTKRVIRELLQQRTADTAL